jgi:hypothetical protein
MVSVCCEVKCKLETTELGSNTIIDALDAARKQTPADRAAIVGLKIPETWIKDLALQERFRAELEAFFRNSDRVVAVVVRWEEVTMLAGGDGEVVYRFRAFANAHSRHLRSDVDGLLRRLTQSADGPWTRLREIVSGTARARGERRSRE